MSARVERGSERASGFGWLVVAACAASAAVACSKAPPGDGTAPGASVTATPSASVAGNASPSAAAPAASVALQAAGAARAWRGSYKSVAAALTLPKGVSWRVPETPAGVGDGTIALTVEGDGRIHGTVEGPIGPATVNGRVADRHVTARVLRSDPADMGFTGTLVGDVADPATSRPGVMTGTMNVALGEVAAVRTATFVASPASPAPAAGPGP